MSAKEKNILIVDNNQQGEVLRDVIRKYSDAVKVVSDPQSALESIKHNSFDLIFTEIYFAGGYSGIDLLREIRKLTPETQVIVVTDHATIDTCKVAMRLGAYDYLAKPITADELGGIFERILVCKSEPDSGNIAVEISTRECNSDNFIYGGVLSCSPAMLHVYKVIKKVSTTNLSVLIEGESGSGKELIARAVHANSPRASKEYQPINCAGLSETLLESELFGHTKGAFTGALADRKGLFEVADKGTLFLDEIGDMPASMQAKLLRVLEDGVITPVGSTRSVKVDVRIVSATNHDLAKLVEEKKFRQDLYFRIKGVSVTLPPLRNRREDIPDLVYYFLSQSCAELGIDMVNISEPAMNILLSYDWPGNIRQLRHAIRAMVVMCDRAMIDVKDIPPDIHKILALTPGKPTVHLAGKSLSDIEREAIESTLNMVGGNREKASKILKIGERTLYRKIKEFGL